MSDRGKTSIRPVQTYVGWPADMKQVIEAVTADTESPGRAPVGTERQSASRISKQVFRGRLSANNAGALGATRANLRIRLAKMLSAELLQLFALETLRSCWRVFSSLRVLSDCEHRWLSTRASLLL